MNKFMLTIAIAGVSFSINLPFSKSFQTPSSELKSLPHMNDFVELNRKKLNIPALTLGIIHDDKIVYLQGYGLNDKNEPVTAQTPFLLASLSKSFTAIAIKQLEEKGKLSLDSPVQNYLPWFQINDDQSASITVRNLLYHTSGFSTELGNKIYEDIDLNHPLSDYVKRLKNVKLDHVVGQVHEYSNINYVILGSIVEEITGMSYADYIQKNIFEPLEMKSSSANIGQTLKHKPIQGYQHLLEFINPYTYPEHVSAYLMPAGFLVSNAEDMTHYLLFHLNGNYKEKKLLSAESLNDLHKPGINIAPSLAYGMGLVVNKDDHNPAFGHNGDLGNFHAEMIVLPKTKVGVVLLCNLGGLEKSADFQKFYMDLLGEILSQFYINLN